VLTIPAAEIMARLLWIQAQFSTPVGQILQKLGRKRLNNYYLDPVAVFNEMLYGITFLKRVPFIARNIFHFK